MEKFKSQSNPEPTIDDADDWVIQANRESLEGVNDLRAGAGLPPVEHSSDAGDYDINEYTGEFYD